MQLNFESKFRFLIFCCAILTITRYEMLPKATPYCCRPIHDNINISITSLRLFGCSHIQVRNLIVCLARKECNKNKLFVSSFSFYFLVRSACRCMQSNGENGMRKWKSVNHRARAAFFCHAITCFPNYFGSFNCWLRLTIINGTFWYIIESLAITHMASHCSHHRLLSFLLER